MRRIFSVCLAFVTALWLAGCGQEVPAVSCGQLEEAYRNAGYQVLHKEDPLESENAICSVRAEDPQSGEYIYFFFFDTPEQAEKYAEEQEWNGVLWFYSAVIGEPYWVTAKAQGNMVLTYADSDLLAPYESLLSQ